MASACKLTANGRSEQLGRYRRLAQHVRSARRDPQVLEVEFDPGVDRALLDETLAVERECCPFLGIEHDGTRLRGSVATGDEDPILDAIAESLAAG